MKFEPLWDFASTLQITHFFLITLNWNQAFNPTSPWTARGGSSMRNHGRRATLHACEQSRLRCKDGWCAHEQARLRCEDGWILRWQKVNGSMGPNSTTSVRNSSYEHPHSFKFHRSSHAHRTIRWSTAPGA